MLTRVDIQKIGDLVLQNKKSEQGSEGLLTTEDFREALIAVKGKLDYGDLIKGVRELSVAFNIGEDGAGITSVKAVEMIQLEDRNDTETILIWEELQEAIKRDLKILFAGLSRGVGRVSLKDFQRNFKVDEKKGRHILDEWNKIRKFCDEDNDGNFSFQELIEAILYDTKKALTTKVDNKKSNLRKEFNVLDTDRSGSISSEEFSAKMQTSKSFFDQFDSKEKFMAYFNKDGTGIVEYEEIIKKLTPQFIDEANKEFLDGKDWKKFPIFEQTSGKIGIPEPKPEQPKPKQAPKQEQEPKPVPKPEQKGKQKPEMKLKPESNQELKPEPGMEVRNSELQPQAEQELSPDEPESREKRSAVESQAVRVTKI